MHLEPVNDISKNHKLFLIIFHGRGRSCLRGKFQQIYLYFYLTLPLASLDYTPNKTISFIPSLGDYSFIHIWIYWKWYVRNIFIHF